MGYTQFLHMIPEATLTAILVIVFFADFFSTPYRSEAAPKYRPWFNTFMAVLMLLQTVVCYFFSIGYCINHIC